MTRAIPRTQILTVAAGVLGLGLAGTAALFAQPSTELIIRNGLIVTATGRSQGDILIRNGLVAQIGRNDLVIWDPNLKRTVRDEDQLSNAKFSIFSGWEITGWPVVTVRRGEVVYEGGMITAQPGSGQLAPRQHWERPDTPAISSKGTH